MREVRFWKRTKSCTFLGIALALFAGLVSQPVAAQGFCHSARCEGDNKTNCDQSALDHAKKDFEQALAEARQDEAKSDVLRAEADELYKEGDDAFNEVADEYGLAKAKDLTVELIKKQVKKRLREVALGKAAADYVEEIFGPFETLEHAIDLLKMTQGMTEVIATDLRVMDRAKALAAQGAQAADDAVAALKRANDAYKKLKDLEKSCESKPAPPNGSTSPKNSDEDNFESSGQKDAEAAEKLLQSWKKVEGGYEDANGDFYDANLAFQQALQIVQAHQSRLIDSGPRFVAVAFAGPLRQGQGTLSATEYNNFIAAWANAFVHITEGCQKYQQIGTDIQELNEVPEW